MKTDFVNNGWQVQPGSHGSGLFFVPVEHEGNQSSSAEEADVIEGIVRELTTSGVSWVDQEGKSLPIYMDSVLIVAPPTIAQVLDYRNESAAQRLARSISFKVRKLRSNFLNDDFLT